MTTTMNNVNIIYIKIKMQGGEKVVSMLHDNVHDSTGGWDVKGVSVM